VYSGHDPICDKLNGTYTDYVYFNGRLKVKMVGSSNYWYIDDALGSTRVVYKGTVKVYSVTTYKPFGIAYGASGTEKFTYAGEIQDSPSGLFYLFARYYNPDIGRFVSLDALLGSLSSPQTLDRYAYCSGNPINRYDPSGMKEYVLYMPSDMWYGDDFYLERDAEAWNANCQMGFGFLLPHLVERPDEWVAGAWTFIPVLGFFGCAYLSYKSFERGDWERGLLYAAGAGLELVPFVGPLGGGAGALNAVRSGWSYTKNTFGKVSGVAGDVYRGAKSWCTDRLMTISGYMKKANYAELADFTKGAGSRAYWDIIYLKDSIFRAYNSDPGLSSYLIMILTNGITYGYRFPKQTET